MVIDMHDPILRRASDKPDNAAAGTWTLFAALAVVAVTLMVIAPERSVQTAVAKMPIAMPAATLVQ